MLDGGRLFLIYYFIEYRDNRFGKAWSWQWNTVKHLSDPNKNTSEEMLSASVGGRGGGGGVPNSLAKRKKQEANDNHDSSNELILDYHTDQNCNNFHQRKDAYR